MRQCVLPFLPEVALTPPRILIGAGNAAVIESLRQPRGWPFGTALLSGPARSGKSLLARWFADGGVGEAIDDAHRLDETELFHRWNRAQESRTSLLLVDGSGSGGWRVSLPDLASRLAAAARLVIEAPDDTLLGELIELHAEMRGLPLAEDAVSYLAGRCERSHIGAESLVETTDRLSLERKVPPTLSIWREAIEQLSGTAEKQPRLL